MNSLWVTFRAIRGYLSKARQAQQQFDEAKDEMRQAAEALCACWEGDAAAAFAKEQGVFNGWCGQMSLLGVDYMDLLEKAVDTYERAEQAVKSAITKQ